MATEVIKILRYGRNNTDLTRASNIVTVTLASTYPNSNLKVGQSIKVAGVTPSSFNGTHVITEVVSQSVYKYAQVGADESSTVDGTSGGDYTTIQAWESANQSGSWVTNDQIPVLECYNDWSSGLDSYTAITGWTNTNSTHYPFIRAAAGEGCDGVFEAGFYVKTDKNYRPALQINQHYTHVTNIEAWNTNSNDSAIGAYSTSTVFTLLNCLGKVNDSKAFLNIRASSVVRNCIAYVLDTTPSSSSMAFKGHSASQHTLESCLAIGGYYGFDRSNYTDWRGDNCVSMASYNRAFTATVDTDTYCKNNASSRAATETPPGADPVTDAIVTTTGTDFVNYGAGDYSLTSGSALVDAGYNNGSAGDPDILGVARGATWDIGPFEYVAPPAVLGVPEIMAMRRKQNNPINLM